MKTITISLTNDQHFELENRVKDLLMQFPDNLDVQQIAYLLDIKFA
jgi:hypothetical protein